jgi:oligosaccharide repeat unit polymerase
MRELIVFGILAVLWLIWRAINAVTLKDVLSPFNLLFYFWMLPLVASYLNWSNLQRGLSDDATTLLAGVTIILLGFSLLPMFIVSRMNTDTWCQSDGRSWEHTTGARVLVVIFFIAACAATIGAEFSHGIPLFQYLDVMATDADLHRFGKDSRLQILAGALGTSGLMSYYIAFSARDKRTKCFFYLLAFIPIVIGVLKTSKSDVFDSIFYYAAIYYYCSLRKKMKFSLRKLAVVLLIGVVAFVGITLVRLGGDMRNPDQTYSSLIDFKYDQQVPWPANEGIAMVYGYATLNFENLSRFMMFGGGQSHWGASMLRPFLSIFMQGQIARDMVVGYESSYHELSGAANQGTFLRDLYFEGGTMFCIVGTVLYAALVNIVYIYFRKRRSPLWMCVYINFLFAWGWLVFNNFFAVLTIYANAAFMVLIVIIANHLSKIRNPGFIAARAPVRWPGPGRAAPNAAAYDPATRT